MTPFNPEGKDMLSYGESIGTLLEINDREDAKQYFEQYVFYIGRKLPNEPSPKDVAIANINYYMGYYSKETERKIRSFNLW